MGDGFAPYPNQPTDASALAVDKPDTRVLRRGSWGNAPDGMRVSARNLDYPPVYRLNNLGFRVLCLSPID